MTVLPDHLRDDQELATRLVAPPGRFGWEYVAAAPPREFDVPAPVLRLPEPPSFRHLEARESGGLAAAMIGLVAVLGGLVGLAQGPSGLLFVIGGGLLFLPLVTARLERARLIREGEAAWLRCETEHDRAVADWHAAGTAHARAEQERVDTEPRWFPVAAPAGTRIDVVGGGRDGQDVLLAVLGCSLVAGGDRLTVLDLTGGRIGGTLAAVLTGAGRTVATVDAARDGVDVLAGMGAADVVETVAAAMHPPARDPDRRDRRDRVAALVAAAVRGLDAAPLSTGRLVDALRVLNRTYRDGRLAADEVERLADIAHDVVVGERTAEELRGLLARWETLADLAGDRPLDLDGPAPLTVLAVPGSHSRHGSALAELLVARLSAAVAGPGAVVVAGADHLTKPVLDELGRRCEDARSRLVLLFEELRDDSLALFGGQGATTVVMQLGQHDQAEAAAKAIGRGHHFVLSQVSRQQGNTETRGGGHSTGVTSGDSETVGYGSGHSRQGLTFGTNASEQRSFTVSHSTTRTENSSWSVAESVTDGQVVARSYDFTVEPTEIQALDTFAFVLVDRADGTRRVRAGNADPRIAVLPLVADTPR